MGYLSGSLFIVGQDAIVSGIAFLTNLIMARGLGPVQLGILYIINLLPSYGEKFGRFGSFDDSAVYYINNKKYSIEAVTGHVLQLSFLCSLLPVGVYFLFSHAFRAHFLKNSTVPDYYVWTAMGSIPFTFLIISIQKILLTQFKVASYNILQFIKAGVSLALIVLFVTLKWDVFGVILASSIAVLVTFAVAYKFLLQIVWPRFRLERSLVRDLFGYGWKLYLTSIINFLHLRIDLVLVAYFLKFDEVSFYSLAVGAGQLLWRLPNALMILFFPKVAAEKTPYAVQFSSQVSRLTAAFLFLSSLGIYLLSVPLIKFFYGQRYLPLIPPLFLLLPGIIGMGPAKVLHQHFVGQGHPRAAFSAALFSTPFNVVLNYLLIPRYGIRAAALVSSLTYLFYLTWLMVEFYRRWKVPPWRLLLINKTDCLFVWERLTVLRQKIGRREVL